MPWLPARIDALSQQSAQAEQTASKLQELDNKVVVPDDGALASAFGALDLTDPAAVAAAIPALAREAAALAAEHAERKAQLELAIPQLERASRAAPRLRKIAKRLARRKPPRQLAGVQRQRLSKAELAEQRLELARLELRHLAARARLADVKQAFLARTQPARRTAASQLEQKRLQAVAERQVARQDQKKALAAEMSAAQARAEALRAQRQARSEAERVLAGERARLEAVRGNQARLRAKLAGGRSDLAELQQQLASFRATIEGKTEKLAKDWPKTAPEYDRLYDEVVKKLGTVRPLAVDQLRLAIGGEAAPPHPGDLAAAVRRRSDAAFAAFAAQRAKLDKLHKRLVKAANRLDFQQRRLVDERLSYLAQQVTKLNERRTALLQRVTDDKHSSLTGLSRATFDQLLREVAQLSFDALYWLLRRWRQVDEVPRMIRDVFTVGTTLWTLVKLIALFLLLRLLLRRWKEWGPAAVSRVGKSLTLGRYAPIAAKLTDVLQHAGPALLVLMTASFVYGMLGGASSAIEVRYAYVLFFWIAGYRVFLRFVETIAKYTGMQAALRAAEGEELLEIDPDLEGPPVPQALRLAQQAARADAGKKKNVQRIEPASVLLVRSVRAASRYILAVILVLEITELAVGKGTIYGLTTAFSWWAALPFVYYFLKLWRPHIVEAYEHQTRGRPTSGLSRAVKRSEERTYGIFVIAAAFGVVFGNRVVGFARRYLFSLDATKRFLAFLFRRQVAKHAEERGRVLKERAELPEVLLGQFPDGPMTRAQAPMHPLVLDEVVAIFRAWEEHHADGSLALIGRAGMGRSTTMRMFENEVSCPVLRGEPRTKITRPVKLIGWLSEVFGFNPRPSSERDLIRRIREDNNPVVTLDNCHNLFLRQVGGFEAWESFVRVVNETCDNVFWLLTFNQAAWDYLYNFGGKVAYFRKKLEIKPWTEKQIRSLLLGRTYRAGFRVSFSDLVVTELQDVSRSAQLGRTSEGYFRLLWDFTGGNPRLASHFWLDSLVPDSDRTLRVNLYAEPEIAKLDKLPADVAFVLTAVATHQNLTAEEAARTTNLSVDFCRFAFSRSLESGYLSLDRDSGRARISRKWQRTLIRYLRRKHLLHE